MKTSKWFFAALLFLFAINEISWGQKNDNNKTILIETELAFAEAAKNTSTRDGFLKFIADDGILFRPHPVNGKEF